MPKRSQILKLTVFVNEYPALTLSSCTESSDKLPYCNHQSPPVTTTSLAFTQSLLLGRSRDLRGCPSLETLKILSKNCKHQPYQNSGEWKKFIATKENQEEGH